MAAMSATHYKPSGILVRARFSEAQLATLLADSQNAILSGGGSKVYEWESGDVKVKKTAGLTPLMMVEEVSYAKAYHGYDGESRCLPQGKASFG